MNRKRTPLFNFTAWNSEKFEAIDLQLAGLCGNICYWDLKFDSTDSRGNHSDGQITCEVIEDLSAKKRWYMRYVK